MKYFHFVNKQSINPMIVLFIITASDLFSVETYLCAVLGVTQDLFSLKCIITWITHIFVYLINVIWGYTELFHSMYVVTNVEHFSESNWFILYVIRTKSIRVNETTLRTCKHPFVHVVYKLTNFDMLCKTFCTILLYTLYIY